MPRGSHRSDKNGVPEDLDKAPTIEDPTTPHEHAGASNAAAPRDPTPPGVSGYELFERIGAGGMGEIWSAEQREGVRRAVAIKLIRPGMGSDKLLARFESERQALALMDHPSIARVFDAGTSMDGRPFFAMEMVEGIPIDEFCDRHRLDLRQRLGLFIKVCDGVQHAHQKAIIHRDLKPSNILVTRQEGGALPKIIDFGLAKAIGHRLAEGTMFTRVGEIMGTPEYMSPEQADPRGEKIDTRTDVYALGMVLYVLLTGSLPFDRRSMGEAGISEFQKLITTQDPPRPSHMVTHLDAESEPVAESRGMRSSTLSAALRGDLDWIVMKALEKSPDRRYGSVEALAADIQRHLSDHTVEARPPSTVYRARKFVRRHTLQVAASAVVVIALVTGSVLATVGLMRARAAQEEASIQAESARRVTEYLVQLFSVSDPYDRQGQAITAREILDRGSEQIADLEAEPLVKGHLEHTMGLIYRNLGLYTEAGRMLEGAVRTLQGGGSINTDAELADAMHDLGVLYDIQGDHDEAERVFREKIEFCRSGVIDNETEIGRSLNSLGIVLWNQGKYRESELCLQEALEIRERDYGEASGEVARTLFNLGTVVKAQDDFTRSEDLFVRALAIERQRLEPDHPDIAASLNNLGALYLDIKRYDDARSCTEEALGIWEKVFDEGHPDIGIAVHNLGNITREEGNAEAALPYYQRAREIWIPSLGEDHQFLAMNDHEEATARYSLGQIQETESLVLQALATWERAVGLDHPEAAETIELYAKILEETDRPEEAARQRALISAADSR